MSAAAPAAAQELHACGRRRAGGCHPRSNASVPPALLHARDPGAPARKSACATPTVCANPDGVVLPDLYFAHFWAVDDLNRTQAAGSNASVKRARGVSEVVVGRLKGDGTTARLLLPSFCWRVAPTTRTQSRLRCARAAPPSRQLHRKTDGTVPMTTRGCLAGRLDVDMAAAARRGLVLVLVLVLVRVRVRTRPWIKLRVAATEAN